MASSIDMSTSDEIALWQAQLAEAEAALQVKFSTCSEFGGVHPLHE